MSKSITTSELGPWPIKNVDRETRQILKRAARKQGKSLGEFFNTDVREWAQKIIQERSEPPAKLESLASEVEGLKLENIKIEKQLIRLQQTINERPFTLLEYLFGKRKE